MLLCLPGFSQQARTDSLRNLLRHPLPDTERVNVLNQLGWETRTTNSDTAFFLSSRSLALAETIAVNGIKGWPKGIANAHHNLGVYCRLRGDFSAALQHNFTALSIREKEGDKYGCARSLGNIGLIYMDQGENEKALDYYLRALALNTALGSKPNMALNYGNIGSLYLNKGDFDKALDYHFRALAIDEMLHNTEGMGRHYGNIANVYGLQGEVEPVQKRKDSLLRKALDYNFKALKISEERSNKVMRGINLGNIGLLYMYLGNYREARGYLDQSLALAFLLRNKRMLRDNYDHYVKLYSILRDDRRALESYKLYIAYRDSLTSEENIRKQTQAEMQYVFSKQQAADSVKNAEAIKQEALKHAQEIRQQRLYMYGGLAGFLLMLVIAGVSFSAYRQKRKANRVISRQKRVVEQKQKEIIDSIHYARKIQRSLMPSEKLMEKKLKELKRR
jgi:tetratricopeptide (TPR) repeat protein